MKRHWQVLGVVVLVSLVVSSVLTGCGASPGSFSPAPGPEGSYAPVSNPVASPAADKSPGEGIKVHGRWTIEVRNPDGTLDELREFENALTSTGSMALSKILGRANSVGGWIVQLNGEPYASGAFEISGGLKNGLIMESTALDGPGRFNNLTVDAPSAGINANKLVLNGTATAQFDGNIGRVSTALNLLPNTVVPAPGYGGGAVFTETFLATPISLLTGQQVLVTVVISFS